MGITLGSCDPWPCDDCPVDGSVNASFCNQQCPLGRSGFYVAALPDPTPPAYVYDIDDDIEDLDVNNPPEDAPILPTSHDCVCPKEVWLNGCKCGGR